VTSFPDAVGWDAAHHHPGDAHAVGVAYAALCRFGDDLTGGQAATLLELWHWQPPLGGREHEALLARFGS
jgi:hypothetical protein